MKKILLLSTFVGAASLSNAQVTVTPEIGYNLGKFYGFNYDPNANIQYTKNFDWMGSIRAGLAFDIPLGTGGASFEPGLYFNSRVGRLKNDQEAFMTSYTSTQNYLEIPLNIKYSWQVSRYTGKLFVQLAPYFAYGISGQGKTEDVLKIPTLVKTENTYKQEWGKETWQYKPFDYGAYVGVGYQFQWGLQVRTIYGLSFSNFSNLTNEVMSPGSVFNLSVGYVLGRKIPGRFY